MPRAGVVVRPHSPARWPAVDVELLTVGTGDNVAEQLVQSDLGARGIRVRVRQTEMGTFLTTARAEQKRFDVLIAGIPGDLSLSYVSALFVSRQRGGTLDYTGFHRPPLDAMLRAAADAPEGAPRVAAWAQRPGGARHARAGDLVVPLAWRAGRLAARARHAHGSARRAGGGARLVARSTVRGAMSLLLDDAALDARRTVAAGALRPLAHGLLAELAPLLDDRVEIPTEKTLMSRTGGRCPHDGTLLRFDPLDPRLVCPVCGRKQQGGMHDRFRPYWMQLWLAERVLHAARARRAARRRACVARRVARAGRLRDRVPRLSEPRQRARSVAAVLQHVPRIDLAAAARPRPRSARVAATHRRALGARVRDRIVEPSARSSRRTTKAVQPAGVEQRGACSPPASCSTTRA
jgi:hypothetical protein